MPRVHYLRKIINSINYVQKPETLLNMVPKNLPQSGLHYGFWRLPADQRHIEQIHHLFVTADRKKTGRVAQAS